MIYESTLANGNKIRLRPFTKDDMTPEYVNWFNDREITRFNSHGLFPYTKTQQEAWIKDLEGSTSRIVWAIEVYIEKVPGTPPRGRFDQGSPATEDYWRLIGNCSLQSINMVNRSGEVAIVIGDKEYWGMGIAENAVWSMLQHAFRCLGLNRVWTGTAATNLGMQRVAEKCRFKQEGTFRDGMFLDGAFVDIFVYAILARQFLATD